jgi:hypothetical protein
MSGCFGLDPIDRWMEKQLDEYLDSENVLEDEEIDEAIEIIEGEQENDIL